MPGSTSHIHRSTTVLRAVAALLLAVAATAFGPSPAEATRARTRPCSLPGNWVADRAATQAYMAAAATAMTDVEVTSGSLTMTMTRTQWTVGGFSIGIKGRLRDTVLQSTADLDMTAPYTVVGNTLHLGPTSLKIVFLNTKFTKNGKTGAIDLPVHESNEPGSTVGYSCSGNTIRLTLSFPGGKVVPITFRRAS